jgi:hypothetical protein
VLVLPLDALDASSLPRAGGKAANLGELLHAGLPVPPGFCVTTEAYALAAEQARVESLLHELASVDAFDHVRQAALASSIRERLIAAPVPDAVEQAIRAAVLDLGARDPVAVRSSATAEDLPFASFAGQQDTFLNVVGVAAILEAAQRCWASLWTDRAVAYRAANGIDPTTVSLAVAVQKLIDASVAGVLFTANPVTGRRRQAVIDASPGLGEAVVSGAVNPDHFVVDTRTGTILERRVGDKRLAVFAEPGGGTRRVERTAATEESLTDQQVRELAQLGARAEAHFGSPQDMEFAIDQHGKLWLTQARPITTLFPLPAGAPVDDENDLRVYFNASVAQGVLRPLTPMGIQAFRVISAGFARVLGGRPVDPAAGTPLLAEAAGRMLADVTGLVRSSAGRRIAEAVLVKMEARSAPIFNSLVSDQRLAPRPVPWSRVIPAAFRVLRATRLPSRVVIAFVNPAGALRDAWRLSDELVAASAVAPDASSTERVDVFEGLLLTLIPRAFPRLVSLLVTGLGGGARPRGGRRPPG